MFAIYTHSINLKQEQIKTSSTAMEMCRNTYLLHLLPILSEFNKKFYCLYNITSSLHMEEEIQFIFEVSQISKLIKQMILIISHNTVHGCLYIYNYNHRGMTLMWGRFLMFSLRLKSWHYWQNSTRPRNMDLTVPFYDLVVSIIYTPGNLLQCDSILAVLCSSLLNSCRTILAEYASFQVRSAAKIR